MILTGSGKEFMMDADPEGFKLEEETWPIGHMNMPTKTAGSMSAPWSTTLRFRPSAFSTARAFIPRFA